MKFDAYWLGVKKQSGFTLPELVIATSVFAILAAIIVINLFNSTSKADINATVNVLVTDLSNQQLRAMVGDRGLDGTSSYGIYFEPNRYTLFKGETFDPFQSDNLTINLPEQLTFIDITLPSSQVVFQKGSGEVMGFTETFDSIGLQNTASLEERNLQLGKYGTVLNVE